LVIKGKIIASFGLFLFEDYHVSLPHSVLQLILGENSKTGKIFKWPDVWRTDRFRDHRDESSNL